MTIENNFPIDKCQDIIQKACAASYDNPNECLNVFEEIKELFNDAIKQRYRYDDLSQQTKNNLNQLISLCSPHCKYNIIQTFKEDFSSTDIKLYPKYKLSIVTTSQELALQVDSFYTLALKALTNPLLKKGVTPISILTSLVDKYTQEMGEDNPDEIKRIIDRLIFLLFNPTIENDNYESVKTPKDIKFKTDINKINNWHDNLLEIDDIKEVLKLKILEYIEHFFEFKTYINLNIIYELSSWLSLPPFKIAVENSQPSSYIDYEKQIICTPFPKLSYMLVLSLEGLKEIAMNFCHIIQDQHTNSILKTDIYSLKQEIEEIKEIPSLNISIVLRHVIENNFNVKLIEVQTLTDPYCSPRYFETSRANVPTIITTRPALVDLDGKVLAKGLYLVPLKEQFTD